MADTDNKKPREPSREDFLRLYDDDAEGNLPAWSPERRAAFDAYKIKPRSKDAPNS